MLYDKRWERNIEQLTSPEALIAWLETMPKDQCYSYTNPKQCMLGQWTKSIDPESRVTIVHGKPYVYVIFGQTVDLARYGDIAFSKPRTFGRALRQAKRTFLGTPLKRAIQKMLLKIW
jgi:hypothetical protein